MEDKYTIDVGLLYPPTSSDYHDCHALGRPADDGPD